MLDMTRVIDERLNSVICAIEDFTDKYRRHDFPPLEISNLYDLFPSALHSLDTAPPDVWPAPYPFDQRTGVYFIFSESFELLYVGKSSMSSCIGKRLWTYFHYAPGQVCVLKHSTWTQNPRFLITVAVPETTPFEAPALEEFLIGRLQPTNNKVGRKRF
jgi:hypothetical protein